MSFMLFARKPKSPAPAPGEPLPGSRPIEPVVRRRTPSLTFRIVTVAAAFALTFAARPLRAQISGNYSVVLNEVAARGVIGGDRAVELYNYGPSRVMTGWTLNYFSAGSLVSTYTFPSFTLPRHAFVVVHWATGTDTTADLYTGTTIAAAALGANGELSLRSTAVALGGVDYLRWGSTSTAALPANLTWNGAAISWTSNCSIRRGLDLNTRDSSNWGLSCIGNSLGALNGGQTGTRRHSRLLINEFAQGPAPWIEIYNPHPITVNSAGLTLNAYDGASTPCASLAFDGTAGHPPASFTAGQVMAVDITAAPGSPRASAFWAARSPSPAPAKRKASTMSCSTRRPFATSRRERTGPAAMSTRSAALSLQMCAGSAIWMTTTRWSGFAWG